MRVLILLKLNSFRKHLIRRKRRIKYQLEELLIEYVFCKKRSQTMLIISAEFKKN